MITNLFVSLETNSQAFARCKKGASDPFGHPPMLGLYWDTENDIHIDWLCFPIYKLLKDRKSERTAKKKIESSNYFLE